MHTYSYGNTYTTVVVPLTTPQPTPNHVLLHGPFVLKPVNSQPVLLRHCDPPDAVYKSCSADKTAGVTAAVALCVQTHSTARTTTADIRHPVLERDTSAAAGQLHPPGRTLPHGRLAPEGPALSLNIATKWSFDSPDAERRGEDVAAAATGVAQRQGRGAIFAMKSPALLSIPVRYYPACLPCHCLVLPRHWAERAVTACEKGDFPPAIAAIADAANVNVQGRTSLTRQCLSLQQP